MFSSRVLVRTLFLSRRHFLHPGNSFKTRTKTGYILIWNRKMAKLQPVVISGPSGSGKSTLLKRLMTEFEGCFAFSISHTTRKPRPGEENGREYHFVSREEMNAAIQRNEFIETAEFSGNLYGTSIKAVDDVIATGKICILDIDMQGVKSIKQTKLNPIYVFVQPPSEDILEKRLRARGTENESSVQMRLGTAKAELAYASTEGAYDSIIVNDDLENAYLAFRNVFLPAIQILKEAEKANSNGHN